VTCCGCLRDTDGILNINKPRGKASFAMVSLVRRLTGERRVGHAGTLDPLASGVLPVCIGQATRVVDYMMDATKVYRAEIEFGAVTDTYDAEGKVLERRDAAAVTREQVREALEAFRGDLLQTAPSYSALKQGGTPMYKLARAGVAVTPRKRHVRIDRIELVDWRSPVATVEVECGKGTYIRSLAHDLGQSLGCGAFLKDLMRLRVGIFAIDDAVTPEELEHAFDVGYWESLLHPLDSVLTGLPAVVVGEQDARAVCSGTDLALEAPREGTLARAYNRCGNLLAVLRFNGETRLWHPEKVFGLI
jgi:tRNA pseudouridine55 synthase